jgi:hypothetical protein
MHPLIKQARSIMNDLLLRPDVPTNKPKMVVILVVIFSIVDVKEKFFFLSGLVRYLTSLTQPPNPFSNKKFGSTFFSFFYNNYFHFSGGWWVCSLQIINFLCYGPSHRPMTTSKGGRRTREREKKK